MTTSHRSHLAPAAIALLALSGAALTTPTTLLGPASGAPAATQLSPYSGPGFDIGAVVALRHQQQAQYLVDHALELSRLR